MSKVKLLKIRQEVKEKALAKIRWQWFKEYKKCKNVTKVCRKYGISRSMFYYWKSRLNLKSSGKGKGYAKIQRLIAYSRKPKTNPREYPKEVIKLIIKLRKRTKRGAEHIWFELKDRYTIDLSVTGIYKVLKRNGLIQERRHKRKANKTYEAPKYFPGEKVQIDVKYVKLVDEIALADIGEREKLMTFTKTNEELMQKKRVTLLKKLEHIRQQLKASINDLEETSKVLGLPIETEGRSRMVLDVLEKEIQCLLNEISEGAKSELADELVKIPGISRSAISIVLSLVGGREFKSRDQLVAFSGIDLTIRESGSSVHGKRRLSKRGDPFLRKKLFQIAWALKMHNPKYQKYYEKKRQEGHHYFTCLIAVARKFLKQIHGTQRRLEYPNSTVAKLDV